MLLLEPLEDITNLIETLTDLIEAARDPLEAPTDPLEATTCSQHALIGTTRGTNCSIKSSNQPTVGS